MATNKENYRIHCEELVCEEGAFLTYSMMHATDAIRHISTDKVFVETVTELVNRLDLDPQRTRDLIEQLLP